MQFVDRHPPLPVALTHLRRPAPLPARHSLAAVAVTPACAIDHPAARRRGVAKFFHPNSKITWIGSIGVKAGVCYIKTHVPEIL
jgi:hypothetical protein